MEDKTEYIEHSAIIKEVDTENGLVTVRVDNVDECGECPATNLCNRHGETFNLVKIKTPFAGRFKENDIVTVRGTEKMHHKAIIYATVLPCLILIVSMVGIYLLTSNQLAAALSGLGMTGVFYFILWLMRNKIAHEFTFTIVGPVEREGETK